MLDNWNHSYKGDLLSFKLEHVRSIQSWMLQYPGIFLFPVAFATISVQPNFVLRSHPIHGLLFWDQGAEENIWAEEGWSDSSMEKAAEWGAS
jgi:hypothetical protein